jgi:hypothetical protein
MCCRTMDHSFFSLKLPGLAVMPQHVQTVAAKMFSDYLLSSTYPVILTCVCEWAPFTARFYLDTVLGKGTEACPNT